MRSSSQSFTRSAVLMLVLLGAGCGTSASPSRAPSPDQRGNRTSGDVPDTAVYLTYHGRGYYIQYVEGWGIQLGPGKNVTVSDKDSSEVVAVVERRSSIASAASGDLSRFGHVLPRFHLLFRRTVRLVPGMAIYMRYRTLSAPDPVTSKRVPVMVDRYYIPGPGRYATVTLSTPVGVDNVDAFRLISRSFRWH